MLNTYLGNSLMIINDSEENKNLTDNKREQEIARPLREEKIKMDPRCNTAVVGEPGFERQPIVYFLYLHIILALD